ncbi:MAG: hypothetical protein NT051_05370 [Candidatus Micrarchaeota archaeon]|nr:hypothetical protein [Candidatus Micrarchaeota archaeon]
MDDEEEVKLDLEERKKSKFYINADGMAYSVMAGLGDAYLPAALVLLGASNFMIGMLAALPQFFGAVVQFLALPALRIFGSRKKMVMASASVQALCWLPIAALLFWPTPLSAWAIILLFSVGFGASLFANPAWSSWVADIVLQNERAGFFANRNRLMQIMLFISIFAAGFAINQMQLQWGVAIAFGVVFLVAFGMRVLSVTFLLKTADGCEI